MVGFIIFLNLLETDMNIHIINKCLFCLGDLRAVVRVKCLKNKQTLQAMGNAWLVMVSAQA